MPERPPESLEFMSNGVTCRGWFYRPDGQPPYACVVIAHGFGAEPNGPIGELASHLRRVGLAAFMFDYPRFGRSDGEPRNIVIVRERLGAWRNAVAFVRAHDDVDAAKVALWGSSLSGGEVVCAAAGDPSIAAVVAQVPYCDGYALARAAGLAHNLRMLPDVLRDLIHAKVGMQPHRIRWLGPPGARAALSARFSDLYTELASAVPSGTGNRVAARSLLAVYGFRPILQADKVRCPLLVVVSYQDLVAPADTAIRAADDMPHAEMAMFSARHFDLYLGEVAERARATEARFLRHHLANGTRTPAVHATSGAVG